MARMKDLWVKTIERITEEVAESVEVDANVAKILTRDILEERSYHSKIEAIEMLERLLSEEGIKLPEEDIDCMVDEMITESYFY